MSEIFIKETISGMNLFLQQVDDVIAFFISRLSDDNLEGERGDVESG